MYTKREGPQGVIIVDIMIETTDTQIIALRRWILAKLLDFHYHYVVFFQIVFFYT